MWSPQECDLDSENPMICCPGGGGVLMGGDNALPYNWHPVGPAFIYMFLLLWAFIGVAICADVFMNAIVTITSTEKALKRTIDDQPCLVRVQVWNDTVANLTLMALGSSAPEIMLNLIEMIAGDAQGGMIQGELGPSTIVGSAAFNLFVIVAICVVSIPENDARSIRQLPVYAVTATGSVLAYVWLLIILLGTSPEMITPGEAVLTLLFMPIFVSLAYMADRWPQVLFGGPRLWGKLLGRRAAVCCSRYCIARDEGEGQEHVAVGSSHELGRRIRQKMGTNAWARAELRRRIAVRLGTMKAVEVSQVTMTDAEAGGTPRPPLGAAAPKVRRSSRIMSVTHEDGSPLSEKEIAAFVNDMHDVRPY